MQDKQNIDLRTITSTETLEAMKSRQYEAMFPLQNQLSQISANIQALNVRIEELKKEDAPLVDPFKPLETENA